MIDFRYHIVSLISVFLALAVGIILGAGPLKESIGDSLTGQVDLLRAEKEEMRTQLDEETVERGHRDEYIVAASKRVAKDSLEARRVGVIQLGAVTDARFESLEQQINYAGATVTSRVGITATWSDPDQAATRVSLADSLKEMLPEDKQDLTPEKTIAAALVVALSEKNPANPDEPSANAELALSILDKAKLVELVRYTPEPVDAVIIVDGTTLPSDSGDAAVAAPEAISLYMNIAEESALSTEGAVVVAEVVSKDDLISSIRSSSTMLKRVGTVSEIDTPMGQLNTPLALSAAIGGKVGHFGFESNATGLVPAAVKLPAPDRSVAEAESAEDANSDGSGDASDSDAAAENGN